MLTMRVCGSGVSFIQVADLIPSAVELLIVKPPPRTPNLPATAGRASTDATALPPLRFRSSPQPHLMTAGLVVAYDSARDLRSAASTPATLAARSRVH